MIYNSAKDWREAARKKVLFFGMSGLGKTYVSNVLRDSGDWFHYSVDYRIGTRYMGEYIIDNAKAEAMKVPFLRDLLLSDSIYIGSNISFENLTPVAAYLGKPGNPAQGGMELTEYKRRQEQFRLAEIHALLDTEYFVDRAQRLYQYPHFICDTGGSICEWVDPDDPRDQVLSELSRQTLMIWIKGDDDHTSELIRRFDRAPKPMSYQPEFLTRVWDEYLTQQGCSAEQVDPNAFIRWTYAKALAHRQPRYRAMADNWGLTIAASDMHSIRDDGDFDELIERALETRPKRD